MPRIRTLKPELWLSAQVMNLTHSARLLFIGLITQADDEGIGSADIRKLKAVIFGGDEVTLAERLEATRLGYAPLRQIVRVTKKNQDAAAIALTPESIRIPGIEVTESPAPATVKGDTTEFRAGAVKTHKDASAEDLVQKLPGVTVEGGQVKAQGENVQQVLVNGRPFFGSDPTAAMRNLPAEVVDRIQVYDRMSDQAESADSTTASRSEP